jgi:hypothetical protein
LGDAFGSYKSLFRGYENLVEENIFQVDSAIFTENTVGIIDILRKKGVALLQEVIQLYEEILDQMDCRLFTGDGQDIASGPSGNEGKLFYLLEMLVMFPEQVPEEGIVGKMEIF